MQLFYYGGADRHLKVRPGKLIGISPLTMEKTKDVNENSIRDHIQEFKNHPSFDIFNVLVDGNKKYLLRPKESFLIKNDMLISNKNISPDVLHLIDKV